MQAIGRLVLTLSAAILSITPAYAQQRLGGEARGFASSIGIKIVPIPSGEFWMGSSKEQIELLLKRYPDVHRAMYDREKPKHRVRITKLEGMSAHEITVGQFRRFVADAKYLTEAELDREDNFGFNSAKGDFDLDGKHTWRNPGFEQSDDHPVVYVSWHDATEFCWWLSKQYDGTYRLPTESEWEYCCRAGTDTLYYNGDDSKRLPLVANFADGRLRARLPKRPVSVPDNGDDGFAFTAPVGHFAPNRWGLYDMHGNVLEWCLDGYDESYYKNSPQDDPWNADPTLDRKVFRGGSWYAGPAECRSADRGRSSPRSAGMTGGFRVVRVPSDP